MNLTEIKELLQQELTPPEEFYLRKFQVRALVALLDMRHNELIDMMEKLEESQTLIKKLYNRLGASANEDHTLWKKTEEYCLKNGLVEKNNVKYRK